MDRPLLLLLAWPLLLTAPSLAATWIVQPDGTGDFPTIQAAVDAASDGDEILLADGVFTGSGNRDVDLLGKTLTIRSESGQAENCTVDGENTSPPIFRFVQGEGPGTELSDITVSRGGSSTAIEITGSSPTLRRVVVRESARSSIVCESSDAVLDGVEVRSTHGMPVIQATGGAPTMTGCLLESNQGAFSSTGSIRLISAQATIENCTIRSCGTTQSVGIGACIKVSGGSTIVRDCELSGNLDGALRIDDVSPPATLLLERCLVEDNAYGLMLWPGQSSSALEVRDCTIRGSRSDGITAFGAAGTTVEDCVVEGNQNGLVLWGAAATVRSCLVRDNTEAGIRARDVTVEGCSIQGNYTGISVPNGFATVRDCLVTGNSSAGIWVQHAGMIIEGCTIAGNGLPSYSYGGLAVTFTYENAVTIRRSIVWGNCSPGDHDIYVTQWATLDLDCTDVDPSRITGPGNIILGADVLAEDPRFCDPVDCATAPNPGGDYRLASDSPALGYPCGPLGPLGAGCTATSGRENLDASSWGAIKARYRRDGEEAGPSPR